MKTRIVAVVVLTVVLFTTTFAKNIDGNVSARALNTFTEKFTDVKDVNWTKSDNFYKAVFTMNDQVLTAYVTEAGEWLGVSRNLLSYQLPINLQADLKKNYSQFWITEIIELATDGGTLYYTTVENADQKLTLKSAGFSDWSVFKKAKKN